MNKRQTRINYQIAIYPRGDTEPLRKYVVEAPSLELAVYKAIESAIEEFGGTAHDYEAEEA